MFVTIIPEDKIKDGYRIALQMLQKKSGVRIKN